jgi:hypothetical protein
LQAEPAVFEVQKKSIASNTLMMLSFIIDDPTEGKAK